MKERIEEALKMAVLRLCEEKGISLSSDISFELVRPERDGFGDYTLKNAYLLAKATGISLEEIAGQVIVRKLDSGDIVGLSSGPAQLNVKINPELLLDVLREVNEKREQFGDATVGAGKKVNNEFVSANPTGPLHLGNARGGFFGSTLTQVLRKLGYEMTNEYYVNDGGEQVLKLGHSVIGDSEAVYGGEYIEELRSSLVGNGAAGDPKSIGERAAEKVLAEYIQTTLREKMGIVYDRFVSERKDIIEAGYVDKALAHFAGKQLSYEQDGALWLKTTAFGDDKDRVLVKSDGTRTYFANDCGYILHKMERGFNVFLETWGADHHGYVARFTAAAKALGFSGDLRFTLVQLVRLVKDGVEVRMSKRAGNVVTVDELIERVGPDVARFFFLMYSPDTHMNFDLGLAEERSQKNPVYYVQYAHARLASVLRKAAESGLSAEGTDLSLLVHEKERGLLREILFFRDELLPEVAETFAVHRLPQFAIRLADRLHSFYDECRVIDAENKELSAARLALVSGVKTVLGETLRLMGVTAPERMEQEPSSAKATDGQGSDTGNGDK